MPWSIHIDTGGTFTDCIGHHAETGDERRAKVLSSSALRATVNTFDPVSKTATIEHPWCDLPENFFAGFQAISLGQCATPVFVAGSGGCSFTFDSPFPRPLRRGDTIELRTGEEPAVLGARLITRTPLGAEFPPVHLRLATTRATNALLERKGAPTAFFTSEGFRDLLIIGDQRRPQLFALQHHREQPIYEEVIPVRGRLDPAGNEIVPPDLTSVKTEARRLFNLGVETAAIAFLNSYANPSHERQVAAILRAAGFSHVTLSSEIAPFIRLLPRAQTAVANAYLAPIMEQFIGGVTSRLAADSFHLMTSAGGLESAARFRPKDSLLSGPAGGVVGAKAAAAAFGIEKIISFDMGGTSTDVARAEAGFSYQFEHKVGPVRLLAPALRIETVAAGGGSVCAWKSAGLSVGPESAGADPGPACYGKGGPLTLTDVNLLLDRLDPATVQIPLDRAAAQNRLEKLLQEIEIETGEKIDQASLLAGLIDIADTKMADAIRTVSVREGYDPAGYTLVAFGGAGPMHACGIAGKLRIQSVLVPGDAGLLSAYGLQHAAGERIAERQILRPLHEVQPELGGVLADMESTSHSEVFKGIQRCHIAELRLAGQDTSLSIQFENPAVLRSLFSRKWLDLFGYQAPADREIELVSLRVLVSEKPSPPTKVQRGAAAAPLTGPKVKGGPFSTLYVGAGWTAHPNADAYLLRNTGISRPEFSQPVAVIGELFRHRFESIVTDMGELLRRTAISTNIKERLDFSCALLSLDGELVVNAPHIPVHLGALGECVRRTVEKVPLRPGDTIITNHPAYGGSHLPDITLITPVYESECGGALVGYVANRAHHAEIGGITPGSMPPGATHLAEEGTAIAPAYLVRAGESDFESIMGLLVSGPHPTRRVTDNESDLRAQLAANRRGAGLLRSLASEHGSETVRAQMERILAHSHGALENAQSRGAIRSSQAVEFLDDHTRIQTSVRSDPSGITFDFTGTSPVHPRNLNATPAIVRSAVLYVLRLALDRDIPLNEGILRSVQIDLPACFLNPAFPDDPERCPAVVGGNVETSQRLVDTLVKALGIQACSQGTMNNFLFGDDTFGYYETICGGSGAGPGYGGTDAIQVHMTNTAITDPEILESRYPVRLQRFEIRKNSGGHGRFDGGEGVVREFEFLRPLRVSLLTQHRTTAPFGQSGGGSGACGNQFLISGGTETKLSGEAQLSVKSGDRIRIETPGGGAWGSGLLP